ncbi:MAG: DUF362 domain-containing protein [Deltaproteobacteria bacterium]|nr:DUF362 domain-containing protein [Deltaproteobacteria bacterium]
MNCVVSVGNAKEYDVEGLKQNISKRINDIGGFESIISRSDRVLLKPNLLTSAPPTRAVVTHPSFVEAVASLIIDHGAKVSIGDSPPLGNLNRVLSKSGYDDFMRRLNVEPCPFTKKRTLECVEGRVFRRLDLAEEVFDFDAVINLPKLKTHTQMGLTLAVKNLFGTVLGTDKASWHLRAGKNIDDFATVLVQIFEQVNPTVSIIDGILGMEGNGPNNGTPRFIGIVAAGKDAVALDAVLASLVNFPANMLRTSVIGQELGLGMADLSKITILGDELKGFPITDFRQAKSVTMAWNLSYWNPVRRFLENHMITRPMIDGAVCKKCGVCMTHCPPSAISETNGALSIDRKKCISCFCCQELCENDAIQVLEPLLGRFFSRVSR